MTRTITIKMDYCADPIWEDGANSDLNEFEGIFSEELLSLLEIYRGTWEKISDNKYMGIGEDYKKHKGSFQNFCDMLYKMQKECAILCKKEQPSFTVIFPKRDGKKYTDMEIK